MTEGTTNNAGCTQFADIVPQAFVDLNPGGVGLQGSLKLGIDFPPPGVKNVGGDSTPIAPEVVYYLDCVIPGAVQPSSTAQKNGGETDTTAAAERSLPTARCAAPRGRPVRWTATATGARSARSSRNRAQCALPATGESINKGICSQIVCATRCSTRRSQTWTAAASAPRATSAASKTNTDCTSGNCVNGVCTIPRCNNLLKDGTETNVDCGGSGCDPCAVGKACLMPSDCVSEGCTEFVCTLCGDRSRTRRRPTWTAAATPTAIRRRPGVPDR